MSSPDQTTTNAVPTDSDSAGFYVGVLFGALLFVAVAVNVTLYLHRRTWWKQKLDQIWLAFRCRLAYVREGFSHFFARLPDRVRKAFMRADTSTTKLCPVRRRTNQTAEAYDVEGSEYSDASYDVFVNKNRYVGRERRVGSERDVGGAHGVGGEHSVGGGERGVGSRGIRRPRVQRNTTREVIYSLSMLDENYDTPSRNIPAVTGGHCAKTESKSRYPAGRKCNGERHGQASGSDVTALGHDEQKIKMDRILCRQNCVKLKTHPKLADHAIKPIAKLDQSRAPPTGSYPGDEKSGFKTRQGENVYCNLDLAQAEVHVVPKTEKVNWRVDQPKPGYKPPISFPGAQTGLYAISAMRTSETQQ